MPLVRDAFMWTLVGVNLAELIGLCRSVILWNKTVIVIDGSRPDFRIQVHACVDKAIAHELAIGATENAERNGMTVRSIYGCHGSGHEFRGKMAWAHRLYLAGQESALETTVADITFMIQRDGERLDD